MAAAQFRKVIDGGDDTGETFVILGAGFPAAGNLAGRGTDFVGTQALEMLGLSVEHADVRAEELVGRASKKIAANRLDVQRAMGRVVYGVDEAHGAGRVRRFGDRLNIVDRAGGVGSVANGNELGSIREQAVEVRKIERAILGMEVGDANDGSSFLERAPGRDVGVVV